MNGNDDFALVPKASGAVEKAQPGTKRVLSGMVADTLGLATKEQLKPAKARFRIGEYEWCEPDYRQILLWAESLWLEPEQIIKRLLDGERALVPEHFGAETRFVAGRLERINWDFDLLPIQGFEWVEGLKTTHLSFKPQLHRQPLEGKTLSAPLPQLTHLACPDLGLIRLDLCRTHELLELVCRGNRLREIDLSVVPKLTKLWCYQTGLSRLDLSSVPNLVNLHCGNQVLQELNLRPVPKLEELDCQSTRLSRLDVSSLSKLRRLACGNNPDLGYHKGLTELNLGHLSQLEYLHCGNHFRPGKLSCLDLSGVPHLVELRCFENEIEELDLSLVPRLERLSCYGNRIKVLDIRPLRNLEELRWWSENDSNKPQLIQRPDQHFGVT